MLTLRNGCKVPFPEKLCEEYMLEDDRIIANISADKISDVMGHFICIHNEPIFSFWSYLQVVMTSKKFDPELWRNYTMTFIILTDVQSKKH